MVQPDKPILLARGQNPPQSAPGTLNPAVWEQMKQMGAMRSVAKRSYLFREGDSLQNASVVVSGLVALLKQDAVLDVIQSGQSVAGALLRNSNADSKYPISALALSACEILEIGVTKNRDQILKMPDIQNFFAAQMQQRMLFMQNTRSLQAESAATRIAYFLLAKKSLLETGWMTRKIIAQACCTSTESVIRQLSAWEKENILKNNGKKMMLINSEYLEGLCAFQNLS